MYLNSHSYFSLRYGTITIQDLVARAKEMELSYMALTDINNTSGVFDFVKECIENEIKPIVGVEFRNGDDLVFIGLAKNNDGFAEINQFLTDHYQEKKAYDLQAPAFENVFVIYPLDYTNLGNELRENEWIGVKHWELYKAATSNGKNFYTDKMLAVQPLTFFDKTNFNLHRLLRAVDHNVLLSKLNKNAQANPLELPIALEDLKKAYEYYPEMIERSNWLAEQCSFEFDFDTSKNKKVYTDSAKSDIKLLRKLAYDGLEYRYGKNQSYAKERIEKELEIIDQLGFASYFLITWDIIQYSMGMGYAHVGRGSGANSIVAYCIRITNVDPIELDLYFERFINPFRTSPPDFDIDFSWDERDTIIEYVFRRYGADYVCLLGAYNTFQYKSSIRELCKVFGIPTSEIEEILKNPERYRNGEHSKYVLKYAPMLVDFPNSLTIHAGGILISDIPLKYYSGIQPMPKGFPICQFDMYVAEDIGFAKFDVLSQRGIGHIKTAVKLIKKNRGISIDINAVAEFKQDVRISQQLRSHETMGAFYVESPAMRQLIWKLNCDNYLTLVAASSIIRPGVASSGMMAEYIKRHHNPSEIKYIHPKMAELLEETYGVMVYQEDVIKVAHHFAGLTLAEADVLRRAMSGKFRSKKEFQRIVDKWFSNCKELGYPDEIAKEVWRQIESFSGYSFSKAHSASYAVESYQSLYLKTYYPLEFMVAVINNFGGFYSTEFYIHEARRCGAQIEAPDVNVSEYLTSISDSIIWLGWIHIKSLEFKMIEKLLKVREEGQFTSFSNFLYRVNMGLEQTLLMIRVGAFRCFNVNKKELMWEVHFFYGGIKVPKHSQENFRLFADPELPEFELPVLEHHPIEDSYDELELLGFPTNSPFDLADEVYQSSTLACNLLKAVGQKVLMYGYLVTVKPVSTKTGSRMAFGYFVDYAGEFFDTTHFSMALENYPFRGMGVYKIIGKVVSEFGHPSVEVFQMVKLGRKPDPRVETDLRLGTVMG
jgi:DNA-directed DNA polymerase III PolC